MARNHLWRRVADESANSPADTTIKARGTVTQGFANQVGNIVLIVAGILCSVFSMREP